jgi:hypothetical protein
MSICSEGPAGEDAADQAPAQVTRRGVARIGMALAGLMGLGPGLAAPAAGEEKTPAAAKKKKKKKCKSGTTLCGGKCVATATDNKNCGKCGTVCKDDLRCRDGKCTCPTSGTSKCGTRCFNLQSNNNNCGACGKACGGDLTCVSGTCACAETGKSKCGDRCFNLQTNSNHCGTCNTVCAGDLTCVSGVCDCAGAGQSKCGNKCYSLQTDMNHCGTCNTVCDTTKANICTAGTCQCGSSAACPGIEVCASGTCVEPTVCEACTFKTVQEAVDAVPAGSTIPIAAETVEGLVTISKNLTLAGAAKATTILTWTDAAYGVSIFKPIVTVEDGITATIKDLTITGGKCNTTNGPASGGGILNVGTLVLERCAVAGNVAGKGGGICSCDDYGTAGVISLTLIDTDVTGNTATANTGGGISSDGSLTITRGEISGNTAGSASKAATGGGIFCALDMTATDVTIKQNMSWENAGGLLLGKNTTPATTTWTLSGCDVADNDTLGSGGGINAFKGKLNLSSATTIRNNTAFSGGGMFISGGCAATLNDTSSITGNEASRVVNGQNQGNGGGAFISFEPGTTLSLNGNAEISGNAAFANNANAGGGGVSVNGFDADRGTLVLNDTSKIRNNTATNSIGGGIANRGRVELSATCEISGNAAATDLAGQAGGGIYTGGFFTDGDQLIGDTNNNVKNNTPNDVTRAP